MDQIPQRSWYAIYTRTNFEKRLVSDFSKKNITAFLPTRKIVRQWSDRKKKIEVPLFPNYLFVKTTKHFKYDILNTQGVVKFLEYNNEMAVIPEQQINDLRLTLLGNPEVSNKYFNLKENVTVVSGHLKGLSGVLLEKRGQCRLVVRIDVVDKTLLVDVSANMLAKIP
ncbi:UpxY family transcription antiterminator [Fulvivirga sp. M361]|uniref:UpxY family transcription antiterminator n=1 Tax=Fulvivirga sp. M361 TaxID=2594266 RepID=UPI00117A1628|nr:UpxY family transcription antiterminator [Fulvivirga sp. M361]TRX60208.1 UpxY family transcription antiterminator [Fulvivirga sp. M361]